MGLMKKIATARQWNPTLVGSDRDTVAMRHIWRYLNPRQPEPVDTDVVNELLDEAADGQGRLF